MLRRLTTITLLLAITTTVVIGQSSILPRESAYAPKGVIYNDEYAVNLTLHSNGLKIGFDKGTIKTYYKTNYYHFDIGFLRHPKEIRQSLNYQTTIDISNSYTYGKQNSFLLLRGGFGSKRYFSEKTKHKGVAVGINYEVGPTLGFTKPYYLIFAFRVDGERQVREIKYSEENADLFLDDTRIQGRAGFFKGFSELNVLPGIHGKFGTHFALGAFEKYVTAMEAGIMVDVFFQEVPIMVIENNRRLFLNVYLTLQLGKRN
ncbi:MAG: hypothetical protein R3275_04620 [Saprospiraceae bacterium]|nr:hypothetical protein [Saprospiraceae bacterium]